MQEAPLRPNHEGETVRSLGPCARLSCGRSMCGRARLSTDVSEIKLVFSIPPHRPTPNFPRSWNVAPTDPLPVARNDTKAGECSLYLLRWGLVYFAVWYVGSSPIYSWDRDSRPHDRGTRRHDRKAQTARGPAGVVRYPRQVISRSPTRSGSASARCADLARTAGVDQLRCPVIRSSPRTAERHEGIYFLCRAPVPNPVRQWFAGG